ncbi:alpha/beta fold hydrolase [Cellulomonas triticagri]|uniref:Alpha/beta hydrolase n=1 Tax=Cellulomonas triticagri TaxID=2483352 RepID=A0A3M2JBY6_9CELL|nr:alpha/beta hydrolase [Cellulomonas triticagri]RMI09746.1 alpha/beta hydrolase [Cellulomonas triticagri]
MTVDSSALLLDGPWRHQHVPANGARFHVAVSGPDDRDAPLVVLLHGLPELWWAWRHQLPALAEDGYRVVAMDLRGTGGSDKPPIGYDVPTLTRDVAGVVRSLGCERAVVVGHGVGGGDVAWAMPAYHPGLVRGVAVLSSPHPLQRRADPRSGLRARAARRMAAAQVPHLPERSMTRGDLVARLLREWGGPRWPEPAALAVYRRAAQIPFAAHSALEQVRWLYRSTVRADGARHAQALRSAPAVPTLQVHGGSDGCYPVSRSMASGAVARALGSQYRFEMLSGAGHYLPEEEPERVSTLLRGWLAELG